jgi:hypothetical protein
MLSVSRNIEGISHKLTFIRFWVSFRSSASNNFYRRWCSCRQIGTSFHTFTMESWPVFPPLLSKPNLMAAHPITPASMPSTLGHQRHVCIIRAMKAGTFRMAGVTVLVENSQFESNGFESGANVPVILSSPSWRPLFSHEISQTPRNVPTVAGGTGISFALLAIEEALTHGEKVGSGSIRLIWVMKNARNIEWIMPEFCSLRQKIWGGKINFQLKRFVTRERVSLPPVLTWSASPSNQRSIQQQTIPVLSLLPQFPTISLSWMSFLALRLNSWKTTTQNLQTLSLQP